MVQLSFLNDNQFEAIKRIDEQGNEFWSGRELMPLLDYAKWQNFTKVIDKAKISCDKSGNDSSRHLLKSVKLIDVGLTTEREIDDYKLSRFACYLIAMNGDSSKAVIANAQTYFAAQTRRQEASDQQKLLKQNQDVTAYQLKGKSRDWAETRVDTKRSQRALGATLVETHKSRNPNFYAVNNTVNEQLFEKTKTEIIEYLGLLPKDAKNYRDHLGEYALDALRQVNRTASLRMRSLGRELTAQEQVDIIKQVVKIVAPTMRELAQYANQDFISGAELDTHGTPLINRNLKFLKDGK